MESTIKIFIQKPYTKSKEWNGVKAISEKFTKFLSETQNKKKIAKSHIPGAQSQRIEKVITPFAKKLGFASQAEELFQKYKVSKLRPDYYQQE